MKCARVSMSAIVVLAMPCVSAAQGPHGTLTVDVGCGTCHTADGVNTSNFEHGTETGFRLDGKHAVVPCTSCHLDLDFSEPKLTAGVCTTCHVDVHRGRLSPDCELCHNTTLFSNVSGLELHARTSFPLSGAHQQISCESCHTNDVGGAYVAQPTDCIACHASEFTGTLFVDHVATGFSAECQECHTTLAWSHGVVFDHTTYSAGFALLGRHADIRCSSCHTSGITGSLYSPANHDDCFACHQSDYDNTHGSTGFPTACLVCHTNESWEGARFADHDEQYFPIFSGAHRSVWSGCETCHTTSDFRQFTCFNCHEHQQSEMDEEHREESGYVYQSSACYACHPNGRSP